MIIKKLLIVFLLFSSNIVYGLNNFIIKDIYFKGLQRITVDLISINMPIHIGDIINSNDIAHTIKVLFSTGNFEDIKILCNKNILIIKVKESPIIANITLCGNNSISDNLLKENLQALNIDVGEILNRTKLNDLKNILLDFYHSTGKYNATIKIIIIPTIYNRINLKLIFNEGMSAKIQQINIIGNKIFTKNQLIKYFQLNDNFYWWNLIYHQEYNKQKLTYDLKTLRNFYFNKGYIKFNINSINISLTPDKKNIYITINIKEGNRYNISSIKLSNNNIFFNNKINKLITIKPHSFYSNIKIINIEKKIKKLLGSYGYIYPNIYTKFKVNNINKSIKLYFKIDVGHRFYVREINFIGNNISKDIILRREIRQMEGTWLNNNLINLGRDRLSRTGFFETIDIKIKRVKNTFNQVDVIYKVKECNTGTMNIGVGFGSENGINFQIGIKQENLIGTGNAISINANKNNYSTYLELSLNNPYFTFNGISLGGLLFYNNFNAKNADLSIYNNKTYGFSNFLSFPLNENHLFRIGLGFNHNLLSNIKPQVSMLYYLKKINKINNFNYNNNYNINDFIFNLGWFFNNLDRSIFPTKGNKISLNIKNTILGSDNEYSKVTFNTLKYNYIDDNRRWILLERIQLGYGFSSKVLPFYENFYVGGFSTVRGFSFNNIGPKAIYLKNNKNGILIPKFDSPSNDSIGGNAMVVGSIELITPIPFIDKIYTSKIRTSLFIDSGTVWDSNWNNINKNWIFKMPNYGDPFNIRVSIGGELQWISQFGTLIFSYAKPIISYKGDNFEEFQFHIGSTW